MKFQLKNILAITALVLTFTSCSKDDDPVQDTTPTGVGTLELEFDNTYGSSNLIIGTANPANSNGEALKVDMIKYIVSNIVLTKADGSTYIVPKNDSYFIVDEAIASSRIITIPNVPAGDYKSVKFGIGVDQEKWALGETGQGNFLTTANTAGMMWAWAAGYRFIRYEGTVTSSTQTDANFKVHTGQSGADYNYREVTLDFPTSTKATVRTTVTPLVHIMADLSVILDGTNKVKLSEGAMLMSGQKLKTISDNLVNMFEVEHVHND